MASWNGVTYKNYPLAQSKYGVKATYAMSPRGITIHNTYNDAPAHNEISYMHSNNNYTSYHLAVDDKEVIQGVPFNRSAWHAGDGSNGLGNRNYIGIEICYSKSGGSRYTKAEENAVKVTAHVLKMYGWTVKNVRKHQDFSGKYCPHRILAEGRWNNFLKRVEAEIKRLNSGEAPSKPSKPSPSKPSKPNKPSKPAGNNMSVVDYMNSKGMNASFANRKKLATKQGIKNYSGTPSQNLELLKKLQGGSTSASKPKPKPSKPSKPKAKLTVDGNWGKATTQALQRYFGTTVDGIVSGQYKNAVTSKIYAVQYGTSGSMVVREMQKWLGVKSDGYFGVETLKALQKRMGTTVDGKLSKPSLVIMEMQRRLNKGKL